MANLNKNVNVTMAIANTQQIPTNTSGIHIAVRTTLVYAPVVPPIVNDPKSSVT